MIRERVALLRQHAAGHHQVGPVEVLVAQLLDVAVDEPDVQSSGSSAATVISPSGAAE